MVEEQRIRAETALNDLVNEVDKDHLRKMQGEMHLCAAKCCDNSTDSIQSVHRCVEQCGLQLHSAQSYIQKEFEHLQNRLQRCVMNCNDDIRDKIKPGATPNEETKYQRDFENCASKCVDSHISLLPSFRKKLRETLTKKSNNYQ